MNWIKKCNNTLINSVKPSSKKKGLENILYTWYEFIPSCQKLNDYEVISSIKINGHVFWNDLIKARNLSHLVFWRLFVSITIQSG